MYQTGKAVRNAEGKIVGGQFMMDDRAGDVKLTAETGRIAPDRRWFGNTRTIGGEELDKFREEMTEKESDPYSVVLARKKLPMGLLVDAKGNNSKAVKEGLLKNESFADTFGSTKKRRRVAIDQLMSKRTNKITGEEGTSISALNGSGSMENKATVVDVAESHADGGYGALLKVAQNNSNVYHSVNTAEGMVQVGRDSNLEATEGEGVDYRIEKKHDLFLKGQSRRIWAELYKVLDCSDVVLHIIDARNVPGTHCKMIERHILNNARHKHLIFVLNKIDLVPNWVAKRWVGELSKIRPTIAFHASQTHAFGKGALISLLRQFSKLHADKKQISVGVVGYPNVGKSSVINTLISKVSCKVAPLPGETKNWQYIALMKRIFLIDSPGVVVDAANDTEEDAVLKGVVRAERLPEPTDFIDAILGKVKRKHMAAAYGIPEKGEGTWKDSMDLLEKIAVKSGRLLKGGGPDTHAISINVINDFQRGKLPYYEAPPELKVGEEETAGAKGKKGKNNMMKAGVETANIKRLVAEEKGEKSCNPYNEPNQPTIKGINLPKQDLDMIGQDNGDGIVIDDEDDEDLDRESGDDEEGDEQEGDEDDSDSDEEAPVVVVGGGDWETLK
jgi:nuclear GTP-binding protein